MFLPVLILLNPLLSTAQQPSAKGKVAGKILDQTTNEPLIGAGVRVEATTTGATADFDGKFAFAVEAGSVTLEAKLVGYGTKILKGIVVKPNETTLITIYLKESSVETKEVQIVADVSKNNENSLLNDQRANNSIGSGVSAELLAKTPDRNLSESFRRISGTSIRDGKFAMVRGLSERYNQGQLNGVSIPSTEPDRKAFALDLFPSNLMDRIVVSKTATPDQPGDFAGGLIKIQTLDIPYSNTFSMTLAGEHHSLTTGKSFGTIKSSTTDWLGFDNGVRQHPTNTLGQEEADINPNEQLKGYQSKIFNNQVVPNFRNAGPNLSGQISVGRRGKVFGKTAGLVASISYYRTFNRNEFFNIFKDLGTPNSPDIDSTHQDRYKTNSNLAGILNFSFKPGASSKISLRNFFTQNGVDQVQIGNRNDIKGNGTILDQTKTNISFYEQSSLLSNQLSFEKYFGTGGAKLEGIAGTNLLYRLTPDFSRLIYQRTGNTNPGNIDSVDYRLNVGDKQSNLFNPGISGKFFSILKETSWSGSLNYTQPFKIAKIKNEAKIGAYYQERDRTFNGRNYLYTGNGIVNGRDISTLGPDSVFRQENFGADLLILRETTRTSDFYAANTALKAAFLMNETSIGKLGTKLIYGVRYESYYQSITSALERGSSKTFLRTRNTTVEDWFPSLNANVTINPKWVVRLAASRTVNRPELRELSGFQFYDPNLNAVIFGNDTIERASVQNFDGKVEFYPASGVIFSVNAFYKKFDRPIELVNGGLQGFPSFKYINAVQAENYGIELEARTRFNMLDSAFGTRIFGDFTLFSNLSVIRSDVKVLKDSGSSKRPIQGQSPYVFNVGLQYNSEKNLFDVTATYNRIGPRVAFADLEYRNLIWERPRDIVDISFGKTYKKFNFKLIFGDIFQQDLIQYQVLDRGGRKEDNKGIRKWLSNAPNYQKGQDIPFFRYTYGRTVRVSVGWKL